MNSSKEENFKSLDLNLSVTQLGNIQNLNQKSWDVTVGALELKAWRGLEQALKMWVFCTAY